ncbi:hypothetical protein [Streptomyces sp. NPDC057616]|uniref:hypothetical protein n=1 Tax=Streptomyces sp. NPDC057616 TaxID=3346183 RepID=UPI00369412AA
MRSEVSSSSTQTVFPKPERMVHEARQSVARSLEMRKQAEAMRVRAQAMCDKNHLMLSDLRSRGDVAGHEPAEEAPSSG